MADFYPVADLVKPQDPNQAFSAMNNILGLQQKRQALQSNALTIQSQQAELVSQQQKASEIKAGGSLMADPVNSGITDTEGNPTKNAYAIIKRAMPFTGDDHYKDLLANAKANLDYKGSFNALRRDARTDVSARLAGVAADPQNGIPEFHDALDNIEKDYAGTPAEDQIKTITQVSRDAIDSANKHHGVDAARNVIMAFSRGGIGNAGITGAGGVAAPSAGTVGTGATTQPIIQAPALAGGGVTKAPGAINNTLAPQVVTGPDSTLHVLGGAAGGPPGAAQGPPRPGAPAAPGAASPPNKLQPLQRPGWNAPKIDQETYNARIQGANEEYGAVAAAANNPQNGVQVNRYRNQQILELTKVAPTGPGKDIWNHVASQFGGESGDAFQKIGHYLAQNSASLAKTMGVPNTNMGAESAAAAAGNTAQNPNAIKEITKVNDALNTAFDLYNRGLAKVTGNGQDFSRAPAFKQAFGNALDVNALRYEDALRRGDKEESEKIAKSLGPDGGKRAAQSLRILHSLADNGDLP